jgi:hypothetical protein
MVWGIELGSSRVGKVSRRCLSASFNVAQILLFSKGMQDAQACFPVAGMGVFGDAGISRVTVSSLYGNIGLRIP